MSRGRERTGCPGSPAEGASSGHLAAAFGLAVGTAYQAVAAANVRRRHPPPDRVVGAGGHRLHLNVTGQDRGGPTVVLEAGGTSFSPQWARVQPGISRFARVISYDRARLGWSEPGSGPRKARSIAREFHMALGNAGIEGPYVPVGSSLGGVYALAFADLYPEDVAGVVLVESMHPDQEERLPDGLVRLVRTFHRAIRVLPLGAAGRPAPRRPHPYHAGRVPPRAAARGADADGGRRRATPARASGPSSGRSRAPGKPRGIRPAPPLASARSRSWCSRPPTPGIRAGEGDVARDAGGDSRPVVKGEHRVLEERAALTR